MDPESVVFERLEFHHEFHHGIVWLPHGYLFRIADGKWRMLQFPLPTWRSPTRGFHENSNPTLSTPFFSPFHIHPDDVAPFPFVLPSRAWRIDTPSSVVPGAQLEFYFIFISGGKQKQMKMVVPNQGSEYSL